MIAHALTIVLNELNRHLTDHYGSDVMNVGRLGNLADGFGNGAGANPRDVLYLSMVNIKEEQTLKNVPNYTRNDVTLRTVYENPPTFLNFQILIVAAHSNYTNALLMLSRAIRFFQAQNVFTQDTVDPASISNNAPANPLDQLESFKLIFDLYSPTMEEVNHLWGTLGGKQYPFAIYVLRMLDLKFRAVKSERGVITEVVQDFRHKSGLAAANE
ncbi:MAG: DUF4255 domain-containing protein [Gammaproteobacteria bacterium HGW-Gammaproteobacteria-10]|nr:MAG: DUF4255 domain-containing protein [Gammaproteobacteria bacterium HGW-Gammaproteobacteria-10]